MAREMRLHASPHMGSAQLFIAYILCSLGGTALGSFLLGQPPGWLAVDRVCACYVVSYTLMRCPPFSSFFLRLFDLPLVLPWLILFQDIGFSHAITSFGFDRALLSPSSLYSVAALPVYASSTPYFHPATHLSFYSAVATAWLSAAGGGLLRHSLCLLDRDWKFQFPHAVLSPPSVHCTLALLLSVAYWAVTDAHGWLGVKLLTASDARFCIMAIVISQVSGKRFLAWWHQGATPTSGPAVALVRGAGEKAATAGQQNEEDGHGENGHDDGHVNGSAVSRRRTSRKAKAVADNGSPDTHVPVQQRRGSRMGH